MPVVPGLVRVSSWELSAKRPELILGAGLLCMKWIRCDALRLGRGVPHVDGV